MDERVKRIITPEGCERFRKNAIERGRQDLADEALLHAVNLRAADYGASSEVERECLKAVYAYEEVLTKKNGKRTKASRTWQMIKRHGILASVERAVDRKLETAGYKALAEMGLQEYAFEAVILRHPDMFSKAAVERSEERMEEWK